ncbi:MAG: roadblock/LC7 domain-containing protein [Methyloprofundus sp.]|nr:roadblock/LC7 domain-containing protein [Methyloprofundus sp.]
MNSIELKSILVTLNSQTSYLKASAVITTGGTILASTLNLSADKNKLAALISSLNILASETSKLLGYGEKTELFLQYSKENLIITEIQKGLLLALLVSPSSLLELDILAIKKNFRKIP